MGGSEAISCSMRILREAVLADTVFVEDAGSRRRGVWRFANVGVT